MFNMYFYEKQGLLKKFRHLQSDYVTTYEQAYDEALKFIQNSGIKHVGAILVTEYLVADKEDDLRKKSVQAALDRAKKLDW